MFETRKVEEERIQASYPYELRKKEFEAIQDRRKAANTQPALKAGSKTNAVDTLEDEHAWWVNGTGLAISGGGIRSAIFALGVLQAMAKAKFLRQIDFLSTVSGGSFIGSYLGRHYLRHDEFNEFANNQSKDPESAIVKSKNMVEVVENILENSWSHSVYWLRENGRYLTPRGGGDVLVAATVALRDWLSVQVFMGVFLLAIFFTGQVVRALYGAPSWNPWTATATLSLDSPTGWPMLVQFLGYPLLAVLGAFAVFCALYWLAVYTSHVYYQCNQDPNAEAKKAAIRREVTEVLSYLLLTVLFLAAYRLIDKLGLQFYLGLRESSWRNVMGALTGVIPVAGVVIRFWANFILKPASNQSMLKFMPLLATCVGLLLLAGYLIGLSAVSYWAIDISKASDSITIDARCALVSAVVLWGISISWSRRIEFINLTTLHALYTARLARAFLGASNPERWTATGQGVTEPIAGDDIPLADYVPHAHGGALHIVNVTLNETVSGESQLEQRDRKGLPVAVSPLAISVGVTHHAQLFKPIADSPVKLSPFRDRDATKAQEKGPDSFAIFPGNTVQPEALSLANWVGISGAAVSTGMGSYSSLGFSMVLSFFNVRLGYWWKSGIDPKTREYTTPYSYSGTVAKLVDRAFSWAFQVQSYLLNEFFGRFHGPGRLYWNLTDGGHFENTAVYELIRRQLPLIICLDNGADPNCEFADLGNLVRHARTDFNADIRFPKMDSKNRADWLPLDASPWFLSTVKKLLKLKNGFFGNLEDLERQPETGKSKCHAAIGIIRYAPSSARFGVLIWVKPSLTGDEECDVAEYQTAHKDFPDESTAEQFFCEAQWESYRELGRHIGDQLMRALNGSVSPWVATAPARPRIAGGGAKRRAARAPRRK